MSEHDPRCVNLNGGVSVDAAYALVGHLAREWGDYGYRIRLGTVPGGGLAVAVCEHSDGSVFVLVTDRWGNRPADGDTISEAVDAFRVQREAAVR